MIDTHCHLDAAEFDADRDQIIHTARQSGVNTLVIPAVAVNHFQQVKTTTQRYPGCHAAYGIHPLYVNQASEEDLLTLRHWLSTEQAIAVGEIGLDYFVDGYDPLRQGRFFTAQLQMAEEFGLPVLLHVRRAIDPVLQQLRRHKLRGGIAHAFNGSLQQAEIFIQRGFKLGFGGAMTYTGSSRIRHLARTLPLSAIVLETDAPDIPPAWLSGQRNSPAELPAIADVLAELRGCSRQEIIEQTGENARQVLPGLRC